MATFIKRSERITVVEFHRSFEWSDMPGAGYGFPCDQAGNVLPASLASYERALSSPDAAKLIDMGVERIEHTYREPAVIRCRCGRPLTLDDCMTNECDCGALYNGSGQELAPREQWGEETGETYSDIVSGHDPERMPGEPDFDAL